MSYGEVAGERQGVIIRNLATPPHESKPTVADEFVRAVIKQLGIAGSKG
jgi:hypothetical protein